MKRDGFTFPLLPLNGRMSERALSLEKISQIKGKVLMKRRGSTEGKEILSKMDESSK